MNNCSHNVLRKKRTADPHEYCHDVYVCGSCATIFDVKVHEEPAPAKTEPMFDRRAPWGLRNRQA
jgi:DNA-directed RNA polymerase subunit RPC12/RpoP